MTTLNQSAAYHPLFPYGLFLSLCLLLKILLNDSLCNERRREKKSDTQVAPFIPPTPSCGIVDFFMIMILSNGIYTSLTFPLRFYSSVDEMLPCRDKKKAHLLVYRSQSSSFKNEDF